MSVFLLHFFVVSGLFVCFHNYMIYIMWTFMITFQSNHQHLFLQGSDRLYLNTGDTILKTSNLDVAEGTSPVRQIPQQQPVNLIGR